MRRDFKNDVDLDRSGLPLPGYTACSPVESTDDPADHTEVTA
jgi:hypothetical protein